MSENPQKIIIGKGEVVFTTQGNILRIKRLKVPCVAGGNTTKDNVDETILEIEFTNMASLRIFLTSILQIVMNSWSIILSDDNENNVKLVKELKKNDFDVIKLLTTNTIETAFSKINEEEVLNIIEALKNSETEERKTDEI